MKSRIYVDMDGVLCDYEEMARVYRKRTPENGFPQASYGFFRDMLPMPNAITSYLWLHEHFDTWILTRPSVLNPMCYTEKREWVEKHLGINVCEKLIMCTEKGLLKGDYLIDDMPWPNFEGKQILFGSSEFPDWKSVIKVFEALENQTTTEREAMQEGLRKALWREILEEMKKCADSPAYFSEKYAKALLDLNTEG